MADSFPVGVRSMTTGAFFLLLLFFAGWSSLSHWVPEMPGPDQLPFGGFAIGSSTVPGVLQ